MLHTYLILAITAFTTPSIYGLSEDPIHVTSFTTITPEPSEQVIVRILPFSYEPTKTENFAPKEVVISAGTTITWINDDTAPHSVTSDTLADGGTGVFDSRITDKDFIQLAQSWSYTFTEPNTYPYHCALHPWMKGSVTVEAPPPLPPPSLPSPAPEQAAPATERVILWQGVAFLAIVSVVVFSIAFLLARIRRK